MAHVRACGLDSQDFYMPSEDPGLSGPGGNFGLGGLQATSDELRWGGAFGDLRNDQLAQTSMLAAFWECSASYSHRAR